MTIERVQIGARMEKRMVKVLKGLAEYLDISLGDLLEGVLVGGVEPLIWGTLVGTLVQLAVLAAPVSERNARVLPAFSLSSIA